MREPITAEQVLQDIEFELIQGMVPHDELGAAIQAVRRFQNQARADAFSLGRRKAEYREIASRQFQINDMLLTLLQEMAAQLQTLKLELRQATGLLPVSPPPSIPAPVASEPGIGRPTGPPLPVPTHESGRVPPGVGAIASMPQEPLRVEPLVRPVRLPLIGRWLTRLRAAFHSLALFYVGRLADQQTAVNRALWESLLELNQMLVHQQQQLQALHEQWSAWTVGPESPDRSADPMPPP